MTESLCCTPETNTTLLTNYIPAPFPLAGPGSWFAKCTWARQVLKGWGRGPSPGLSSTEVQAVAEGAGPAPLAARSAPGPPPLPPARP